ncbi:MAG: TerB family tellurite resistance protein [Flavobacteriaceae bacterium]|nr:TerB family tellurite resistance protein [Flavobacteriaceae bacterium]
MSSIFSSNFKNRNRDHFSSIVKIALSDNIITDEERKFINRLAILLEIESCEAQEIISNPNLHQITPPSTEKKRLERLFDLSRIVVADEIADKAEIILLNKFAIALGFSIEEIDSTVKKAIKLVQSGADEDDFIAAFK